MLQDFSLSKERLSRQVLIVPGGFETEPFLRNRQTFVQTLQPTEMLQINTPGGSCPQQPIVLSGLCCSGVMVAVGHSSWAVGKVSLSVTGKASSPDSHHISPIHMLEPTSSYLS